MADRSLQLIMTIDTVYSIDGLPHIQMPVYIAAVHYRLAPNNTCFLASFLVVATSRMY